MDSPMLDAPDDSNVDGAASERKLGFDGEDYGAAKESFLQDSASDTSSQVGNDAPVYRPLKQRALAVPRKGPLPRSSLPTGLCYDPRMRFHAAMVESDHHPEDPRRIYVIYERLCESGLVEGEDDLEDDKGPERTYLHRIEAREATLTEICLVHTPEHYEFVRETATLPQPVLNVIASDCDSIYLNNSTFFCSKFSVGGAIECCVAVTAGEVRNALAVIRPPGHHAFPGDPQGFCIFNNVSVATRVCQEQFPAVCRKVLIFDWDVHHGNGTQVAFYEDPNVLYISVHVYQNGDFYPNHERGDHTHCGEGKGAGRNVNIPWSKKGMTDSDYMYAFQKVVMPIATEFDPDLVIVSAGFDAAMGDELGGCFVTPACYAHMTYALMSLAEGKVVVCLEGGYNLDSISKSALAVTKTLMGEPPDRLSLNGASNAAAGDVELVMRRQARYWACMREDDIEFDSAELGGERLHDIIRQYQSYELYKNHSMINLPIMRERVSDSFENQVLATPNYSTAATLLVVFHDPPEMMGKADPTTKRLDLHKTWLADHNKMYLKWAHDAGYGIIDVNIPKFVTDLDGKKDLLPGEDSQSVELTKELVVYLWENYIEVNACKRLFLLGIGDAHYGTIHMINSCERGTMLQGVVNLISNGVLRSVKKDTDPFIADWYKKNSQVFVNQGHTAFQPGRKGLKRRFGTVIQSPKDSITSMLRLHHPHITRWFDERIRGASPKEA
ncbi:MAG: Histone deacetylase hda1 [Thelocarpon impressellum]|nr:MAG: Histone deacetylase hda1 [Thelocarpon impressellum]